MEQLQRCFFIDFFFYSMNIQPFRCTPSSAACLGPVRGALPKSRCRQLASCTRRRQGFQAHLNIPADTFRNPESPRQTKRKNFVAMHGQPIDCSLAAWGARSLSHPRIIHPMPDLVQLIWLFNPLNLQGCQYFASCYYFVLSIVLN